MHPFIVNVQVPDKKVLSNTDIDNNVVKRLAQIPGDFVFLKNIASTSIYIYSFKDPEQCSSVREKLHEALPPIKQSETAINEEGLCKVRSVSGAGSCFMHGNSKFAKSVYNLDRQECSVVVNFTESCREYTQETDRRDALTDHLRSYFSQNYNDISINVVNYKRKEKQKNYCMYTGGGHITIERKEMSFIMMTHLLTEVSDDSPTEMFEDLKDLSTMSYEDVLSQLQANMYLALSNSMVKKIYNSTTTPHDLQNLQKLTIYGMALPARSQHITILKLIVDFTNNSLKYEEKFQSSFRNEAIIDCSIDYVVQRLCRKSPSPT